MVTGAIGWAGGPCLFLRPQVLQRLQTAKVLEVCGRPNVRLSYFLLHVVGGVQSSSKVVSL